MRLLHRWMSSPTRTERELEALRINTEMLAALRAILDDPECGLNISIYARTAIAKAEGKP